MRGVFTSGLILGAVTTAAIIEKKYAFNNVLKKSKKAIKRKINDIIG